MLGTQVGALSDQVIEVNLDFVVGLLEKLVLFHQVLDNLLLGPELCHRLPGLLQGLVIVLAVVLDHCDCGGRGHCTSQLGP